MGCMEGVLTSNPLNQNPNWIRRCLNMYAYAQTFLLHHTWACNAYVHQKIYGPSCLMNLGRVVLKTWAEAELAWAELVLGGVVRNSFRGTLHR